MNAAKAIEHIRNSVRAVIPPGCIVEFSGGQSGNRGVITRVRIDAWIGTDCLLYDQPELLRRLQVGSAESDGDDYALFSGTVYGVNFELRLFAEPQVVTSG